MLNLKEILDFVHTYFLFEVFIRYNYGLVKKSELNTGISLQNHFPTIGIYTNNNKNPSFPYIHNMKLYTGGIYTNIKEKDREILYTAFKEAKDVSLKIEQVLKNTEKELKEYIFNIKDYAKIKGNKGICLVSFFDPKNTLEGSYTFSQGIMSHSKFYYLAINKSLKEIDFNFNISPEKDIDVKYKGDISIKLSNVLTFLLHHNDDPENTKKHLLRRTGYVVMHDYGENIGKSSHLNLVKTKDKEISILPIEKNILPLVIDSVISRKKLITAITGEKLIISPRKNYYDVINQKFITDLVSLKINPELVQITSIIPSFNEPQLQEYNFIKDEGNYIPINPEQYTVSITFFPNSLYERKIFTDSGYCRVSFNKENELVLQDSHMCERISAWSKDLNVVDMGMYYQNFAEWLVFKALPHIDMVVFEKLTNTKLHKPTDPKEKKKSIMENLGKQLVAAKQ